MLKSLLCLNEQLKYGIIVGSDFVESENELISHGYSIKRLPKLSTTIFGLKFTHIIANEISNQQEVI
jgi:hypothetical protein